MPGVVFPTRPQHKLSYWRAGLEHGTIGGMDAPSPAPWTFADSMYGIGNRLIDRDGRVIGTNLPIGNAPLLAQAPATVAWCER